MSWRQKIIIPLLLILLLTSCGTALFYGQAIGGQLHILSLRQDIGKLIAADDTDPNLKARLERVLDIREFAARELHLPLADNYSTYVNLKQPFAAWNVFAAEEFSMEPLRWCFPVAGCVSYRGYFSEAQAHRYAETLKRKDYDVHVGGVAAYSTLGWFSDPLLNTVVNWEDDRLAGLIFHELAHQLVYVKGDTEFNESFALSVELEGVRRWLQDAEGDERAELAARQARLQQERRREFAALVARYVGYLDRLYQSERNETEKRAAKQDLFQRLRGDYQELRRQWGGYDAYDGWFSRELNNAKLNTVAIYFNWLPSFENMLREKGGDLREFYAEVEALARLPAAERARALTMATPAEASGLFNEAGSGKALSKRQAENSVNAGPSFGQVGDAPHHATGPVPTGRRQAENAVNAGPQDEG